MTKRLQQAKSTSDNTMIQPLRPVEIEGQNFRRGYRERQIGPVYTLGFEVEKALWDACETIPRGAILKGVLWWVPDNEEDQPPPVPQDKPKKNVKPEKGPHGEFWRHLYKNGFDCSLDLRDALGIAEQPAKTDDVKHALYEVFHTDSLTKVSPNQVQAWASKNQLNNLVTIINQAELRIANDIRKGYEGEEE